MIARKYKSDYSARIGEGSPGLSHLHWFLAVIGIVTAIICSFILISDVNVHDSDAKQSVLKQSSLSIEVRQIRITNLVTCVTLQQPQEDNVSIMTTAHSRWQKIAMNIIKLLND